jgi:hypothetical protein
MSFFRKKNKRHHCRDASIPYPDFIESLEPSIHDYDVVFLGS